MKYMLVCLLFFLLYYCSRQLVVRCYKVHELLVRIRAGNLYFSFSCSFSPKWGLHFHSLKCLLNLILWHKWIVTRQQNAERNSRICLMWWTQIKEFPFAIKVNLKNFFTYMNTGIGLTKSCVTAAKIPSSSMNYKTKIKRTTANVFYQVCFRMCMRFSCGGKHIHCTMANWRRAKIFQK